MPKAPRQETSSSPFPFVRQFTAPPFFVGIEDATLKSKLLLDAVQHTGPVDQKAPAKKRKPVKKKKPKVVPAKKRAAGKGKSVKKR